jgi:hypothetical protein
VTTAVYKLLMKMIKTCWACISTSSKCESLIRPVGWFVCMYDDAQICKP